MDQGSPLRTISDQKAGMVGVGNISQSVMGLHRSNTQASKPVNTQRNSITGSSMNLVSSAMRRGAAAAQKASQNTNHGRYMASGQTHVGIGKSTSALGTHRRMNTNLSQQQTQVNRAAPAKNSFMVGSNSSTGFAPSRMSTIQAPAMGGGFRNSSNLQSLVKSHTNNYMK